MRSARGLAALAAGVPIKRSVTDTNRIGFDDAPPAAAAASNAPTPPLPAQDANEGHPPIACVHKPAEKAPTASTAAADSAEHSRHSTAQPDACDDAKGITSPDLIKGASSPARTPSGSGASNKSETPASSPTPAPTHSPANTPPHDGHLDQVIAHLREMESSFAKSIKDAIPSLEMAVKTLNDKASMDSTVSTELQRKIDDITSKLTNTEAALSTTNTHISGLDYKVKDVKEVKSSCDKAVEKLTELSETVGDLSAIREVFAKLTKVPDQVDATVTGIGSLSEAISTLTERVQAIEERLQTPVHAEAAEELLTESQAHRLTSYQISRYANLMKRLLDREYPSPSSTEEEQEQSEARKMVYRTYWVLSGLGEENAILEKQSGLWNPIDDVDEEQVSKEGHGAGAEKEAESDTSKQHVGMKEEEEHREIGRIINDEKVLGEISEDELQAKGQSATSVNVERREGGEESGEDMAISTGEQGEEKDAMGRLESPAHHTRQASKRARSKEPNPGPAASRRRVSDAKKGNGKPPSKAKGGKPASKAKAPSE